MAVLCKPGGVSIYKVINNQDIVQVTMLIYKESLYACFGVSFINNARNKLTINVCNVN